MTTSNGHSADDLGKPCCARIDGDHGGWCVLPEGHDGPHAGVATRNPQPFPNPHTFHKFKLPPINRKPEPKK